MHFYMAIKSKKRTEINSEMLDRINAVSPSLLGFDNSGCFSDMWSSENKDIFLGYWTNENTKQFQQQPGFAFSYAGYTSNSCNELSKTISNTSNAEHNSIFSNLEGLYTAIYTNSDKSYVQAWNTVTRVEPLYWTENDDFVFIGNRALLLHLISNNGNIPNYELNNLVPFLNTGYFNSDYTPYKDINVLPPNSTIFVDSDQVVIKEIDNTLNKDNMLEKPDSAFYDDITEAFINSFKPIKNHNQTLEAAITGGKDSRLIVSALKYINADFTTYTHGFKEHPDVIIGEKIANELNVSHNLSIPNTKKEDPSVIEHDLMKRVTSTLFSTEGMISAYENIPVRKNFNDTQIILGGHGGEHLRGGYHRVISNGGRSERLNKFGDFLTPFQNFIISDKRMEYQKHIENWTQNSIQSDSDVLSRYFVFYRSGRWSSVARTGYTFNNYLYQPFFDSNFNKLLLKLPAEYMVNDEVNYNILKRLAPELVDIPFFADRWKFESKAPRKGYEKQWKKRTPILAKKQSKGSFNWRKTTLSDMKEAMTEEVFKKNNEDLFTIVDKKEVVNLFNSEKYASKREIDIFVWNLYTASVMLSNKWLSENRPTRIVEIDLPSTKIAKVDKINFIDSKMESNTKDLHIKSAKYKLTIKYGKGSISEGNLYVQTFGGNFTSPPDEKYNQLTKLGDFKEYKIEFVGSSRNNKQKIAVFFMCYNEKVRIFNKSVTCTLTKKHENYSIQFKPPKNATRYKIAFKIIRSENTKEKIQIEKMTLNSLI